MAPRKYDLLRRLDGAIQKAYLPLLSIQASCKPDFDRRVKRFKNINIPGDYVFLGQADGLSKTGNLGPPALGPYRVQKYDGRTFVIQREDVAELVNSGRVTYAPPLKGTPPSEDFTDCAPTEDDLRKNTVGPTYVVNPVTDHRTQTEGAVKFLVKCYGYLHPTWEPR